MLETPPIDVGVSVAAASTESRIGGPVRFAEPFAVEASTISHGRWEASSEGQTAVWRLRVVSDGAVSLNLGFDRYRMPPGGWLRVHTPDGAEVLGPYTDTDNEAHGELWTPVLPGDEAVIEVSVPVGRLGEVELQLGSVNRGFRHLNSIQAEARAACNIDVACREGDLYRDQIRGVGLLQFGGSGWCSGVLLNNTAEDGKPYFLTARHCGFVGDAEANARSAVVYWNYQKADCGSGSGSRSQSQSGAHFRAAHVATDIALIELDDALDPDHELFLAGWDRGGATVGFPVGVHHARADVKSITPFREPAVPVYEDSGIETPDGDYFLTRWTQGGGIIEPGSSGSPLFDDVGRAVGTSSRIGIGYGCGGGLYWGGRLARAWDRLGIWLDPGSTGATSLDGIDAATGPLSLRALDDKALKAPGDGQAAEALEVDVAPFFWSLGAMTYTASSSDESAATVSVSGSRVSLTPVAAGSSTITVTAADAVDSSRSVTGTFLVTVGSNRSPEPSGTFADRSLNEGATSQVALASAFTDGDGDTLTYAASSTDTSAATVALSGSSATVTAVNGPGTATIDVTATDAGGSNTRARHRFEVTVLNHPPRAVGSLADVLLRVGEGNEVVDVAGAFTEPEGEALTYRARSSASSVVRSTVSGSEVTLIPVSDGTATITVFARDQSGSKASATNTIDVVVRTGRGVNGLPGAVTVWEGSTASYTVALNTEPTGKVTVTPSALTRKGVVSVNPSSLEFDATDWETAQTVTVAAAEDPDRDLELGSITHTVSGADYDSIKLYSFNLTVLDDESPLVSIAPASAGESGGALTFDVTLSHAIRELASVEYATSDGSGATGARAGADYTAASGTLTFPAGTTARQIVVDVTDDGEYEEESETFRLTLRNARNLTLDDLGGEPLSAPGSGHARWVQWRTTVLGTIEDDEGRPVRAEWDPRPAGQVWEEEETHRKRSQLIQLDREPERLVRVSVELVNHGGADETDYYVTPASFEFPTSYGTGLVGRVEVVAVDDEVDDDCESVELKIVSESPGVTAGAPRTILIVDDDGATADCGSNSPPGGDGPPGGGGGSPPPPEPNPESPPPPFRPPAAAFAVEGATCDAQLCRAVAGEALRFTDTSTGTVRFRRWEFGDGDTSRSGAPVHAWSSPGFHEVMLEVSDGSSPSTARRTFLVTAAEPAGTCTADAETLCLQDSRYTVTVEWRDGEGGSGAGRVVHAGTNDSGMFSFFNPSNWEVLIKVLDGCAANGQVWVFGGSTTDLGYMIRVTDTATGAVKEYRNEPGTAAAAITDVAAFPGGCRP